MSMVKLSFQDQSCDLTLEEGLEEYRAYLQANGKKQLIDKPDSQLLETMMQLTLSLDLIPLLNKSLC